MELPIEVIVFWILLLDSLIAAAIAWFGQKWYIRHFRVISRFLPMSRAWATGYLILVLWIGFILYRSGMIIF